jgi:hypothetical protein
MRQILPTIMLPSVSNNLTTDRTALTLAAFRRLPRVRRLLDTTALKEDLAAAYGARNVIAVDYDSNWVTAFLRILGVAPEGAAPLGQLGNSIPDWMVPLVRRLNGMGLDHQTRIAWLVAMQSCFGLDNYVQLYAKERVDALLAGNYSGLIDPVLLDRFDASSDKQAWAIERLKEFVWARAAGKDG